MNQKVIHLITGLGGGGAERMLLKLLGAFDYSDRQHSVVTMTDISTIKQRVLDLGIHVTSLHMKRGVPDPIAFLKLLGHLKREKPDVLQTWLYHADLMGIAAAKTLGIKHTVWNIRNSYVADARYSRSHRTIVKVLARISKQPSAVIANSSEGKLSHERVGYQPKKWVQISNGFDVNRFKPALGCKERVASKLEFPSTHKVIGIVARHHPLKDYSTFLRAASKLIEIRSDIHFIMAGIDVEPTNFPLVSEICSLGLEKHCSLIGVQEDLENWMPAFDLISLSSVGEGFPNVVGEAMACGVAYAGSDVGAIRDVVGTTGWMVPPKSPEKLCAIWVDALSNGTQQLVERGELARARIQDHFSIRAIAGEYEELYRSCV